VTTKIEQIYEAVLPELAAAGFEDTLLNRYHALQGLREAWREDVETDPDVVFEKVLWMIALDGEILILSMKLAFQNLNV
jgi:hypothetical protein